MICWGLKPLTHKTFRLSLFVRKTTKYVITSPFEQWILASFKTHPASAFERSLLPDDEALKCLFCTLRIKIGHNHIHYDLLLLLTFKVASSKDKKEPSLNILITGVTGYPKSWTEKSAKWPLRSPHQWLPVSQKLVFQSEKFWHHYNTSWWTPSAQPWWFLSINHDQ